MVAFFHVNINKTIHLTNVKLLYLTFYLIPNFPPSNKNYTYLRLCQFSWLGDNMAMMMTLW